MTWKPRFYVLTFAPDELQLLCDSYDARLKTGGFNRCEDDDWDRLQAMRRKAAELLAIARRDA